MKSVFHVLAKNKIIILITLTPIPTPLSEYNQTQGKGQAVLTQGTPVCQGAGNVDPVCPAGETLTQCRWRQGYEGDERAVWTVRPHEDRMSHTVTTGQADEPCHWTRCLSTDSLV